MLYIKIVQHFEKKTRWAILKGDWFF